MDRKIIIVIVSLFLLLNILLCAVAYHYKNAILYYVEKKAEKQTVYYAEDFGIEVIKSNADYDNDGIDDYMDIVQGARIDAENKPNYRSAYYAGGYPPDDEGVCTDVVWRALKNAGYTLKDMVDADIAANVNAYHRVEGKPDKKYIDN